MEIVRKNYADLPPTRAPHYQAVRVGNWLFLSGATARDTEAAHGDMAAQTEVIFKRMQHILEAEGGSLHNVVKITSFVTDISSEAGAATHRVREKYFGSHLPASTRVQVAGLVDPNLKIEIEAIAVLPGQSPAHTATGLALGAWRSDAMPWPVPATVGDMHGAAQPPF